MLRKKTALRSLPYEKLHKCLRLCAFFLRLRNCKHHKSLTAFYEFFFFEYNKTNTVYLKKNEMKEGYVIRDQTLPHFITATVVDWIDVFTRQTYRDIVIESLDYCIKNKGMILYGYVIMSNHIHLILQSQEGELSALVRDFKKFTAKSILEKIQTSPESRREWMLERFQLATKTHSRNKEYQFWQYGNHAEEIYSNEFM